MSGSSGGTASAAVGGVTAGAKRAVSRMRPIPIRMAGIVVSQKNPSEKPPNRPSFLRFPMS